MHGQHVTRIPDFRQALGQLANFHMMDTRQYRHDQLAGDGWKKNVTERLAEDRTITGTEQEKWLLDGFKNSTQRWDILGQQVFFAERDRNAVVLTGDVHRNWASDLKVDYKDPASPVVGSELVCTSNGNGNGNGNGSGSTTDPMMAWNPHLKFYNDNRGYVNTKITKDALTADFRTMSHVTTPGAPVSTKASFAIRDGVPGLQARA